MMASLKNKFCAVQNALKRYKRVLIAYSGGVDSTFLAAVARETLGKDNVLAVTAVSETYPEPERRRAKRIARSLGLRHRFIHTGELSDKRFSANPENRCFYCKDELFRKLSAMAKERDMTVIDGSNYSDRSDYRPGKIAARKWRVRSPLADTGFTKENIRTLSKERKLVTWNMPAQACLASRIPYGTRITADKLQKIEKGEELLRKKGFAILRLRDHGEIVRIETSREEQRKILDPVICASVISGLKRLGWRYIALDLEGYRTGSMNPPARRTVRRNKS